MVYAGFTCSYGLLAIARIMIRKQYQHTAVAGAYAVVSIAVETFAVKEREIKIPESLKDMLYDSGSTEELCMKPNLKMENATFYFWFFMDNKQDFLK